MRCEKHCTDLSSIAGVCATCLRQRLFRLIVAQDQAQAQSLAGNNCNSDKNPALPRPVSPYISRQKSDNSVASIAAVQRQYNKPRLNHSLSDQRFYNSPQIVLNTGGCIGGASSHKKKQSLIRLSSISNLFRSNNRNGDAESAHRVSVSSSKESYGAGGNPTSLTSSPSWFSNAIPGGGSRQKNKAFHVDDSARTAATGVVRKQRYVRDRGMSPVRSSDDGGDDELNDGSSDYESAESCKQTPQKNPAHHTIRHGHRSVSELIFCLSPLVRASPSRLWKGKPPADAGGDIRAPAVPHLSYTKSFHANRSRKLADFGRSDPNR
ncbi:hypothetical protein L1887_34157 [Cichorium endivia]|nr:hypothetical protein L1887_34157 [Cichorium endivia]